LTLVAGIWLDLFYTVIYLLMLLLIKVIHSGQAQVNIRYRAKHRLVFLYISAG